MTASAWVTERHTTALLEEHERITAAMAALLRRLVVRVVAVVKALPQLYARSAWATAHKPDAPGLDKTSYASFTAAILASEPPLSGCAVRAALRNAFLIVLVSASRATLSTL